MDNFIQEFKNIWSKPNNALRQIISINIMVFLVLATLHILGKIFGFSGVSVFVHEQFSIPPVFTEFLSRPWTLFTYAFSHSRSDLLHILFNMLILYWFGKLIVEYLGSQKLINLYVLGALAGGAIYLLVFNLVPYYKAINDFSGMVGASAAVYAITVAAAVLVPEYTFYLMLVGPVKIKYIAAIYILFSFLGTIGDNAGGNIAHLGGALMGYVYIKQLHAGSDWGKWIYTFMTFVKSLFVRQPKLRVTKTKRTKRRREEEDEFEEDLSSSTDTFVDQAEIDAILDKISRSGYDSLTEREKQKLFNASKK